MHRRQGIPSGPGDVLLGRADTIGADSAPLVSTIWKRSVATRRLDAVGLDILLTRMERAPEPSTTARPPAKAAARAAVGALLGAVAISLAARLSFSLPGAELPQSAQTLAVLLVAAALGVRWGVLSVGIYVFVGALGLPVFAEGAGGLATVLGPSRGYLVGFGCAAAWVGYFADAGRLTRRLLGTVGVMFGAHAWILLCGGLGLISRVGAAQAWSIGVVPFLVGGAVKSGLAAMVVVAVHDRWPGWFRQGRR